MKVAFSRFKENQNVYRGHSGPEVDAKIKDSMDLNVTNLDDWAPTNSLITDAVLKVLVSYMSQYYFMLIGATIPLFKHPESGETCKLTHENYEEFGRPYVDTLIAQT